RRNPDNDMSTDREHGSLSMYACACARARRCRKQLRMRTGNVPGHIVGKSLQIAEADLLEQTIGNGNSTDKVCDGHPIGRPDRLELRMVLHRCFYGRDHGCGELTERNRCCLC